MDVQVTPHSPCAGCRRQARNADEPCRIHARVQSESPSKGKRTRKTSPRGKGGQKSPSKSPKKNGSPKKGKDLTQFFTAPSPTKTRSSTQRAPSNTVIPVSPRRARQVSPSQRESDSDTIAYGKPDIDDPIEPDSDPEQPVTRRAVLSIDEDEQMIAEAIAEDERQRGDKGKTRAGPTKTASQLSYGDSGDQGMLTGHATDGPYQVPHGVPDRVRSASGRTKVTPLPPSRAEAYIEEKPDYDPPNIPQQLHALSPENKNRLLDLDTLRGQLRRREPIGRQALFSEPHAHADRSHVKFGGDPGQVDSFQPAMDRETAEAFAQREAEINAEGEGDSSDDERPPGKGSRSPRKRPHIVECGLSPERYKLPKGWTSPARKKAKIQR